MPRAGNRGWGAGAKPVSWCWGSNPSLSATSARCEPQQNAANPAKQRDFCL